GRKAADHLQRPPALPLRRRQKGRRYQRPGPHGLRRRLVRPVERRQPGLCPELGRLSGLGRRGWLLATAGRSRAMGRREGYARNRELRGSLTGRGGAHRGRDGLWRWPVEPPLRLGPPHLRRVRVAAPGSTAGGLEGCSPCGWRGVRLSARLATD